MPEYMTWPWRQSVPLQMLLGHTQVTKIEQQHPVSSSKVHEMLLGTYHWKILYTVVTELSWDMPYNYHTDLWE